ncbi:MAG: hypothetical protein ACE5IJ_03695 [Thermoplasmata archaeon]
MLEELEDDVNQNTLYRSKRLNQRGRTEYPGSLRNAIQDGNDATLAQAIRAGHLLKLRIRRRKPKGGFTLALIPRNAPETLAEGEFNRFYLRGLSRRALNDGIPHLLVYRAKRVGRPRSGSQARIGMRVSPDELLADLREHAGDYAILGIPAGPNSGLSARLP